MISPSQNFWILEMNFHFVKILKCLKFLGQKCKSKPCPNQEFFMLLERFQNINIKSELAFSIWSCELKVMGNKRFESQIVKLIVWPLTIKTQGIKVRWFSMEKWKMAVKKCYNFVIGIYMKILWTYKVVKQTTWDKNTISMQFSWRGPKYIIRKRVVASSQV